MVILVVTMAVGFGIVMWRLQVHLDHEYEQRALAVAESVAALGPVQRGLVAGPPHGRIEGVAAAVRRRTGAAYVVVTNARGIRYSHPNHALIGKPVYDDPEKAASEPYRTGTTWVGIQTGTLGATARGKAPVFNKAGDLIGETSVGFPVAQVTDAVDDQLPTIGSYLLGALGLGVLAALGLARSLKRQTFGLELDEIAALLQEREAMLHGVREGVIGYDHDERVLLVNDQARELLHLPGDVVGRPVRDLLPPGRIRDVVRGVVGGPDLVVVADGRILVANRTPMRVEHRRHLGWVVTFHDRTEPEGLLRELDTVLALTDALRAQSHEFSNRLHTLAGLVELGHYEEAVGFVTDVSARHNELTDRLQATLGSPMVVALLLAKTSVAAERRIDLNVTADSGIDGSLPDAVDVLTVLGNLIDNAMDASLKAEAHRPWVEVSLVSMNTDLIIKVADSGPGVAEDERDAIFADGFTTKDSRTGARRGLGLALVRQLVERRRGMVEVDMGVGAVFTVVMPGCVVPWVMERG